MKNSHFICKININIKKEKLCNESKPNFLNTILIEVCPISNTTFTQSPLNYYMPSPNRFVFLFSKSWL